MSRYVDSRDVTAIYHQQDIFSTLAHKSIKQDKALIRAKVTNVIRNTGINGATCDQVEQILEMAHQTASARITEAKALDLIIATGARRKTRSGRSAAVYVTPDNYSIGKAH